jgi:hypothetical protein
MVPALAHAAEFAPQSAFEAVRINDAIQLDGKIDERAWQTAQPVWLGYEFDPGENSPAPQKTEALALFDRQNLYLGFRCYDTRPDEIRANISDRDKIFQDDYIIVLIDTYNDYQRAYEFAVNPFGIQGDLMATLNGEDVNFDLIWHSAAVRSDSGWTAEMAIPFKSLRFPNRSEQTWLIHLVRNYPRTSRVKCSWMPINRNDPSFISQGGLLHGLRDIASSGSIEVLPYAMGQHSSGLTDTGDPDSPWHNKPINGRVGAGLQYAPGPNFSLDTVINPDFSQIESDADQISVNTTFALDYPEKRPFFLIGQELLQTPMYYSRSINNPSVAGRIIGKSGSLSYLCMGAYDRNTSFVIPGEESSDTVPSEIPSMATIGRLRYDLGNESYIGGMLFGRDMSDAHNYLLGFDWNYRFQQHWYFTGETFLTHTQELNDTTLFQSSRPFSHSGHDAGFNGERYHGSGLHAVLSYGSRSYNFDLVYNDFTPTYQTYNGMFPSVDYRQAYMQHVAKFYPKNSLVDRAQFYLAGNLQYNHLNIYKEHFLQPGVALTLKGQTILDISLLQFYDERFNGTLFTDIDKVLFSFSTHPANAISFSIDGRIGDFIYRSDTPAMGKGHSIEAGMNLKPTSRLSGSFTWSAARLVDPGTKAEFYDGFILRSLLIYQFSPELFVRAIAQYNSFAETYDLYPLFSYKLNAFTTFYAGMTNNYYEFGSPAGVRSTDRQIFAKMQYLFRK